MDGRDGLPGADGVAGPTGLRGASGVPGADGIDGRDGIPGAAGRDGLPGADGLNGTDGSPGADGVAGATGPQGLPGATGPAGHDGADGLGPAYLDTGDATAYTASDTHTLASVSLPPGTYTLQASVFVTNAAEYTDDATISCAFGFGVGASLLTPQPQAIIDSEGNLNTHLIPVGQGIVTISGNGPVSARLTCASTNAGTGLTLTGTLLALRVSSATVT